MSPTTITRPATTTLSIEGLTDAVTESQRSVIVFLIDDVGPNALSKWHDVNNYTDASGTKYDLETAISMGLYAETPNIDLIVNGGMRFRQFRSSPLCTPTRAEIYTGRKGNRTGIGDVVPVAASSSAADIFDLGTATGYEETRMLPNLIRNAPSPRADGHVGKFHTFEQFNGGIGADLKTQNPLASDWEWMDTVFNSDQTEKSAAEARGGNYFSVTAANPGGGGCVRPYDTNVSGNSPFGVTTTDNSDNDLYWRAGHWNLWSYKNRAAGDSAQGNKHIHFPNYSTLQTTEDALEFLDQLPEGQGCVLNVWFNAAHSPFELPPPSQINSAAYTPSKWPDYNGIAGQGVHWTNYGTQSGGNIPSGTGDTNSFRGQQAQLEDIDSRIGQIVAAAPANTTFLVVGDNGWDENVMQTLESAGIGAGAIAVGPYYSGVAASELGKGTVYEEGVRSILAISGSGVTQVGTNDEPVSPTDLYTTIAHLIGYDDSTLDAYLSGGKPVDGKSLTGILDGSATAVKDEDFGMRFSPLGDYTLATDEMWFLVKDIGGVLYKYIDVVSNAESGIPVVQELYNLTADPTEQADLGSGDPNWSVMQARLTAIQGGTVTTSYGLPLSRGDLPTETDIPLDIIEQELELHRSGTLVDNVFLDGSSGSITVWRGNTPSSQSITLNIL